jgi:hypothetical protein
LRGILIGPQSADSKTCFSKYFSFGCKNVVLIRYVDETSAPFPGPEQENGGTALAKNSFQ